MTTVMDLLKYIKKSFGHPYQVVEISDEDITEEIIQDEALKQYSTYYPWIHTEPFDPDKMEINQFRDNNLTLDPEFFSGIVGISDAFYYDQRITVTQIDKYNYKLHDRFTGIVATDILFKCKFVHKTDLSTMTIADMNRFKKLALILAAKKILPIRKYNNNISTPIGEIALDVETPQTLADSYDEFVEKELHNVSTFSSRLFFRLA